MVDYCLFTIEHKHARRIYIRGVADITEPIDEFDKIIKFYEGSNLQSELPSNPYDKSEKDYELFEELVETIKEEFNEIGEELIFAEEYEKHKCSGFLGANYYLDTEKVII